MIKTKPGFVSNTTPRKIKPKMEKLNINRQYE